MRDVNWNRENFVNSTALHPVRKHFEESIKNATMILRIRARRRQPPCGKWQVDWAWRSTFEKKNEVLHIQTQQLGTTPSLHVAGMTTFHLSELQVHQPCTFITASLRPRTCSTTEAAWLITYVYIDISAEVFPSGEWLHRHRAFSLH